ncbi:MAG: response regulator [Bacteroidales bacterium]|jgi:CheY-like chemotaxis protein|nr:response regulator [Bacteroidales bacterium]
MKKQFSSIDTAKITVLLAEDDEASRLFLDIVLRKHGFMFYSVNNGLSAWEYIEHNQPNVVFADITLPQINGWELLKKIKQRYPHIIVVMITAYNSEEFAIQALKLGASSYLKKPISQAAVVDLLQTYELMHEEKNKIEQVCSYVESYNLSMKINNDIHIVPFVAKYLISQVEFFFKENELLGMLLGLNEIIINAIEHGNLKISFTEKTNAIQNNTYETLLEERMNREENKQKKVLINFFHNHNYCEWTIKDSGTGFLHKNYLENSTFNSIDGLHGRVIFITRFQFDEMDYEENGTKICLRKYITKTDN